MSCYNQNQSPFFPYIETISRKRQCHREIQQNAVISGITEAPLADLNLQITSPEEGESVKGTERLWGAHGEIPPSSKPMFSCPDL